ncbi:hypothetical protein GCM10010234_09650 [Streptomyces hawaiiensis]
MLPLPSAATRLASQNPRFAPRGLPHALGSVAIDCSGTLMPCQLRPMSPGRTAPFRRAHHRVTPHRQQTARSHPKTRAPQWLPGLRCFTPPRCGTRLLWPIPPPFPVEKDERPLAKIPGNRKISANRPRVARELNRPATTGFGETTPAMPGQLATPRGWRGSSGSGPAFEFPVGR